MVGHFGNATDAGFHGFLLSGGIYTTIDPPGSTRTIASGINDSGQIVGNFNDAADVGHGFLLSEGSYTTIDVPGSVATSVSGINASGQVVGSFFLGVPIVVHGFLFSGGSYTTIDVPGSVGTSVSGINASGQVVGTFGDAAHPIHGFLLSGGRFTTIDPPGSTFTNILGINGCGQMVGFFQRGGVQVHGFLAGDGDTDGDGLCDSWETDGVTVQMPNGPVFIDLPGMGADAHHKDIFVQTDYMVAPSHSHKPYVGAMGEIIQAFANAPVMNPDGTTGITLHVDCGPDCIMKPATGETWGSLSKATALPHQDILGYEDASGNYDWGDFTDIEKQYFVPTGRQPIFHYAIFAHQYAWRAGGDCSSGISSGIGASEFIVSLGCWPDEVGDLFEQAGTFMHEFGHNLGLLHGGVDSVNYKPNYLSVMNYLFQFSGILHRGSSVMSEGTFDYSRFSPSDLPPLNKQHLDETVGPNADPDVSFLYGTAYLLRGYRPGALASPPACIASAATRSIPVPYTYGPIDWNCDGITASDVPANINIDPNYPNDTEILNTFNDWPALVFRGGAIGSLGALPDLPTTTPQQQEMTPQDEAQITRLFGVLVSGRGLFSASAGTTIPLTFTVSNQGINSDTYALTVSSSMPWANVSQVPPSLTLAPGASQQFLINVSVPVGTGAGTTAAINVNAISQTTNLILDQAEADVTVTPAVVAKGSTTAVASSLNPSLAGQSVTFTATVTSTAGGTPTGTVTFFDGTTSLGTGGLNASGVATYATTALASGSRSITANYGGDANYAASTSSLLGQTVNVFGFAPVSGVPPVTAGQSVVINLVLYAASSNFALSCLGTPSKSSCSFSPNPAAGLPNGTAIQMTFSTSNSELPASPPNRSPWLWSLPEISAVLAALLGLVMSRSRYAPRRRLAFGFCLAVVVLATVLIGCGGGGDSSSAYTGTPKGTVTFTVTGTSGATIISTPVNVTVQ